MKSNIKSFSILWFLYAIFVFPSFYFVYKFGNPSAATTDFFSYYNLYSNWDIANVDAPFNMRLLSSFFVFLFNKIGFHYDTVCAFDQFHLSKQVFFNAILFNYLCVVSTCVVLYKTTIEQIKNQLLAFISGLLYLLGFGTLFFELMPITDALSILIFSIIFYFYLKKSYYLTFFLLILIIQREYIFLAMGLISLVDFLKFKSKYFFHVLLISVLCFAIYFILRKTIFFTPRYDDQASPKVFLENLFELKFPLIPFIKQTVMTLNIFIVYIMIVFYKKFKNMEIDKKGFIQSILLFFQIVFISLVASFGNNTGRYFYIIIPFIIFQLVKEVKPIIKLS